MNRPSVDFWYCFTSTYSYVAAMRVEAAAEAAGVAVRWRPFLLGPIMAAQGWTDSPFNLYPAKGRYMWRDVERQAARHGLPFKRPDPFPQNTLVCSRLALVLRDSGLTPAFSRAAFAAAFGRGLTISDPGVLAAILKDLGVEPSRAVASAQTPAVKGRLRAETEEARSRGIFGAPSFVTADGELFWGNDRLEEALAWAMGERVCGLKDM